MDIIKLIRFIKQLKPYQFDEINVNKAKLIHLKEQPNTIYKTQYQTVETLYRYMLATQAEVKESELTSKVIGIDLGTKHLYTCCDLDLTDSFTYNSNHLRKLLTENTSDKKIQLENEIGKAVNQILKHYGKNNIFVLGKMFNQHPNATLLEFTYASFVRKLGKSKIKIVDETNTSITCPKCGRINKKSRTKTNRFNCKSNLGGCGFKHDNDDVVASCNIARKYMKGKGE